MENPFSYSQYQDNSDLPLIELSLKGDRNALNKLLGKHQNFIYNIALKMLNDVVSAQDASQEILLKLLTNLSQYDASKASFRTWLYRITFNHVLNVKKSPYEKKELSFSKFFDYMATVPDLPIDDLEEKEMKNTIEESKVACTAGMLMCLDRNQRLIYIVGEVFEIDHKLAAEIFEISPDNFRQKLSRARKDLYQWMHNRCGLVNFENPCRCKTKTKGFIQAGHVNPENLKWLSAYKNKIFQISEENLDTMLDERDSIYKRIYQEHPFKQTSNAEKVLDEIVSNTNFSTFFKLN